MNRGNSSDDKLAKLEQVGRLIEEINEAEKDDPEWSWRPWRITREQRTPHG